ncbi:SRPBCC family protein [Jatrophihabitans fulvus]
MARLGEAWGVTTAEHAATYPCDELLSDPVVATRGVDVAAPPSVVFRWVCQVRVAPYSYDLVDNLGRRSPRTLTPGLDRLEVGQRFGVVFRIRSFATDEHVTAAGRFGGGRVALTYRVVATDGGCRLLGRIAFETRGRLGRMLSTPLVLGDLVMMRKQLRTLRALAERSAAHEGGAG